MIQMLAELVIALLLVVGGSFGLIGSWGLVRLPDAMTRLHAPTKTTTLGVGCVLIAAMLNYRLVTGMWSWHELLIAMFLALTSPATALFIAKANMILGWSRDTIPRPPSGGEWTTYADPCPDEPATGDLPPPPHDGRGWE